MPKTHQVILIVPISDKEQAKIEEQLRAISSPSPSAGPEIVDGIWDGVTELLNRDKPARDPASHLMRAQWVTEDEATAHQEIYEKTKGAKDGKIPGGFSAVGLIEDRAATESALLVRTKLQRRVTNLV